jgi:hypothetical protein
VKNRDDDQAVGLDPEVNAEGKAFQRDAPDVLMNNGIHLWLFSREHDAALDF